MAKLDELLGKYLPEWPDWADACVQDKDKEVKFMVGTDAKIGSYGAAWLRKKPINSNNTYLNELAEDWHSAIVTKSQYLAASDRIATNMQATKEARDIAQGEGQRFCSSEHMIAAIESEELPKPDRKLWKRAALAAFAGYCARPGIDAECAAEEAMFAADAFMNEMEKHLNGGA